MAIYDDSLWDEDVWDGDEVVVPSVLAFVWTLQPEPAQGEDMPLSVNYVLTLQRVDSDNGIRNTFDPEASITIPDNLFGDSTYCFVDGTVDKPVGLITDILDLVAISTDQEITVKFNDILGTPFTLRAGGALLIDGKNITAIFISNSSGYEAHPRIIQAIRQEGHCD